MKLLLLSNKFPYPANDGSSIAIMSMIELMLHQKIELHLFSLNTQKHFKNPELFKKEYPDVVLHEQPINTNITPLNTVVNLLGKSPFHVSRFYNKEIDESLKSLLIKEKFDIIQFEGIFLAPYLDTVKENSTGKIVLRLHNIEHVIWERQLLSEKNLLKKWYLNIQSQRLKKYELSETFKFDALLPISPIDGDFFHKQDKEISIKNIPTAINLQDYQVVETNSNDFFYIGALDWMPNILGLEWFVNKVWPIVINKIPDAKFYVAGRAIPSSMKNLKIKGLFVVGEVDSSKDFFNSHKIFVVPLLSGSGIRIKIIEAFAYGKTVVSTSIGAEGIETTDNNIVLKDTSAEMAEELIKLYNNKELVSKIGKEARLTAETKYGVELLSKELVTFYKSIA